MKKEQHHMACQREVTGRLEPCDCLAGWEETSERCQLLIRALDLIRNFHDCPPVIRALAENAINWTPTNDE